jgi:lipoprotein-releasing system permease protein
MTRVPFAWFVAIRYLREGRSQTLLILAGVTTGVAITIFLSALIGGLQRSLIRQTLGSQAHVVVAPAEEQPRVLPPPDGVALAVRLEKAPQRLRSIHQWQQVLAAIRTTPGVVATSPMAVGAGLAARGNAVKSIVLMGIEPATFDEVIPVRGKLVAGDYDVSGASVVVGRELADDLGVGVGDRLRISAATGRDESFTIGGVVELGVREVDQRWVLAALRPVQTLLDLQGGVSTIEVRVAEVFDAERIARAIAARTGLAADSWMAINAQLLVGLEAQASSKLIIQVFIVIAVLLGIASVLAVSVVQKSREIGILKAVGTPAGRLQHIFLLEGAIVGLVGSLAGSAIGAILSLAFASAVKNPDGTPRFPADLPPSLFLGASAIAVGAGLVGALLPARRAARLDPATVIRYG